MGTEIGMRTMWNPEAAQLVIDEWRHLPGALLPVLHALQAEFGYIHAEAVPLVAQALNLSNAEVQGVISFYHDFRRTPPARHVLKVCRAEACQAMGGESLAAHLDAHLESQPDAAFTLEPVYCLGNCALSPSVMLDGQLYGRVSPESIDQLLKATP